MDSIIEQMAERARTNHDVISLAAVRNPSSHSTLTDGYDLLFLVVANRAESGSRLFHYIKDNQRIQERWIDPETLEHGILHGQNRNFIHWILKGEIVLDRNTYLEGLRHRLLEFPPELRELRLLIEFSSFLRCYTQSREHILEDQLLDAYNDILETLRHWARIVIIEEGIHPEVTVWKQVKAINPGVYKLYEELTLSTETLKQRIQLVLLASEFSVMSKMEKCCKSLLDILKSRPEAWSMNELQHLHALKEVRAELPMLINKLVKKTLIKEIVYTDDQELELLELRYTIA
ncbi:nucleotidyltransferase-like protein [Paenibacillus hamazuiensis]|uniref:nucleotidyltransferase-like protein n=1 Tax=Paenibacillus hamazuiensis TaxID=2936508 RepID=UPI00200F413F|nr:nucleotidyltransferase-like protein [Paenibacillus hamazuiensis]